MPLLEKNRNGRTAGPLVFYANAYKQKRALVHDGDDDCNGAALRLAGGDTSHAAKPYVFNASWQKNVRKGRAAASHGFLCERLQSFADTGA